MTDTILLCEDDPVQNRIIGIMLSKKLGYRTITTESGKEAINRIRSSNVGEIGAVLLDIEMPEMDGFETLRQIRKYRPDLPVVMLTGKNDTDTAVTAIKEGASDFIVKPPRKEQLQVVLSNAIRMSALARELAKLKRDKAGALGFSDLVGHDHGLTETIAYARKAAVSDAPALLTGEIGTGRELLARAIHGESHRAGAPFVAIHCDAIPEHTLEAVLFGHEKGAAVTPRSLGKFREAERGTLFLDDVHALSMSAQSKLLRVLQQREIDPIGANKPVKVNVRVISATDRNLKAEVSAGRFREDLYFRLNVLMIAVPPLRERKQDILSLADYFMHQIASIDALPLRSLAADAKHYLNDYSWPGNVRELESLMHRALALCEDKAITRALLRKIHDVDARMGEPAAPPGAYIALRHASGLFKTMAEIEAEALEKALEHSQGNVTRAAQSLGMAKSTFYRKKKEVAEGILLS